VPDPIDTAKAGARILVVRLGAMGDILHALPAVASLKSGFPGSHLTWVVEPRWAPLLEANAFVDRVALLRRGNLRDLYRSWRELRTARYDVAVDFQGLIKSALVAWAARPERIYGFDRAQVREPLAALFYSHPVRAAGTHVVERNLFLAIAAGASTVLETFPLPPGRPEAALPEGGFVLASPLAGWRAKQWPLEYYAALAARLKEEMHLPLVLDGPPAAAAELAAVPHAVSHCSTLAGLIYATRRATAVVGIDSGPMHLAAALAKPGVAIFGPTDPARNGPFGASLAVLRSPSAATTYKRYDRIDPSMREITPDMVFEALRDLP
jgi:heptosyltransferase-1